MGAAVAPSAAPVAPAAPVALRRGRAALVVLAVAPWLGLLAALVGQGALALVGQSLALLAALHGMGALVGWAAAVRGGAWQRVTWGAATMIALGGALMMMGGFGAPGQSALFFLGVIAHSAALAREARATAVKISEARGSWLAWAGALAAVTALHVLGAAGAVSAVGNAAWDGEANALGQLRLLADTGHLGDAVGLARAQSLGGGLILRALAGLSGARTMDAWGMAVFLALAISRLRRSEQSGERASEGALWAGLVLLAGVTFSRLPVDAALYWWPAALLLSGALSLEEEFADGDAVEVRAWRRALPAMLLAAALAVIHHALSPAALALGGAALWPHRRSRGALALVAVALAAVTPYLVEWGQALAALPASAVARALPRAGLSPLRLGLVVAATAVLLPLVRWLVPARRAALVFAAALAGGVAPFAATRGHAGAYVFAAAFAMLAFSALGARGAPGDGRARRALPLRAALLSLFLIVSIYEAQERRGGLRWSYRWAAMASSAGYVVSGPVAPPSPSSALSKVPTGARVALWIGQPELLDHRRHRVFDLRTPHLAALRAKRPERFLAALAALAPDYLLYEEPLADRGTFLGRACATVGACEDVFAHLASSHRTVWRGDGLRLIALR